MHFLAHLSYPYIIANGIALIMGKTIPIQYNILIILFSLFPDIDLVYDFIKQKITTGKYIIPKTHHNKPTHWPIVYVPLIFIAFITMNPFFIIAASTIYLHLIMDTFFCNQGIMWLYPFNKKWFNYYSETTKRKFGLAWNNAYKKLDISKIDKIAFTLLIIHISIFALF